MPNDNENFYDDNLDVEDILDSVSFVLSSLYADDSHFVYEILQNAEDAHATSVKFILFEDRLEIEHNGTPFNENDARAIARIAKSTKTGLNTVGKFGLGFKSIYSVTDAPEVHSGEFHFKIEKCVRRYHIAARQLSPGSTTLFVLPFKSGKAIEIHDKLSSKLQQLGARVSLFLKHIESIVWEIKKTSQTGTYLKEVTDKFGIKEITCLDDNTFEKWLVFSQQDNSVEIAFKYNEEDNIIEPVVNSTLSVLFPTDQTTGLKFLVNGKFQTTPARDNIPLDNEHNKNLVVKATKLLKTVLDTAKANGFLGVELLNVLPIKSSVFQGNLSFWMPLYEETKRLLLSENYIPTVQSGVFENAENLVIARSQELIGLYSPEDKQWLTKNITRDKTPELFNYLTDALEISVITPESFCNQLTQDWLNQQCDEWFKQFYAFLLNQYSLWCENTAPAYRATNEGVLRSKTIIRLETNELVTPNTVLFLPGQCGINACKTVKNVFASDKKSMEFLTRLGLKTPDIFDLLEQEILNKRYLKDIQVTDEEYKSDIEQIKAVLSSDGVSDAKKERIKSEFLIIRCEDGQYRAANQVYLNTPDLKIWFENQERYFTSDIFENSTWIELGVSASPRIKLQTKYNTNIPEYKRATRRTSKYDDGLIDVSVDGIEQLVVSTANATIFSKIIFELFNNFRTNTKNGGVLSLFKSEYIWRDNGWRTKSVPSGIFDDLSVRKWIMTLEGALEAPKNIDITQLHPDVAFLSGLPGDLFGGAKQKIKKAQAIIEACGQYPVICKTKEQADAFKRFLEELEKTKMSAGTNSSDEPDVNLPEGEIKPTAGVLRPVSADRGVPGSISSPKTENADTSKSVSVATPKGNSISSATKNKLGYRGEESVKKYLIDNEHYLDSEIQIMNTDDEMSTGYDILVKRDGVIVKYIEVKSTTAKHSETSRHAFEVSGKQWEVARANPENHWIYCVFEVNTLKPEVVAIQNPIQKWKDGILEASPVNFMV